MLVDIRAIVLSDEDGAPVCTKAKVNLAISDSIAMQIIPVDSNGTPYPGSSKGIVGVSSLPELEEFYTDIQAAVVRLLSAKGL